MVANKIILNGKILLDLSGDSATEPSVEIGKIFHKANGEQAVGEGTTAPTIDYYDSSDFLADANGITFTINGVEYKALAGMTWADWCGSEYNTNGYYTGSDSTGIVYSPSGNAVLNSSHKAVTFDIEIISGHAYVTVHGGGSND